MLKLAIGVTRKVGLPNYGSIGANCSLEADLDHSLIDDPERLHQKLRSTYAIAWEAVELQLQERGNAPTAELPTVVHSESVAEQPATARQVEYAHKLADQIPDIGSTRLTVFTQDVFGKSAQSLSCSEASRLIDLLKQIRAGKVGPNYEAYAEVA